MRLSGVVLAGLVCGVAGVAAPAMAQDAPKFVFEGDLVRGGGPNAKGPACVLANQYQRKETVAFRVRVIDPRTGKNVDDKGLKSLVIELANGQKVTMNFHGHPPRGEPTDHFWSGSWAIPEDHPTGSFGYKVVATGLDGQTATWQPFQIASSQLTIVAN